MIGFHWFKTVINSVASFMSVNGKTSKKNMALIKRDHCVYSDQMHFMCWNTCKSLYILYVIYWTIYANRLVYSKQIQYPSLIFHIETKGKSQIKIRWNVRLCLCVLKLHVNHCVKRFRDNRHFCVCKPGPRSETVFFCCFNFIQFNAPFKIISHISRWANQ